MRLEMLRRVETTCGGRDESISRSETRFLASLMTDRSTPLPVEAPWKHRQKHQSANCFSTRCTQFYGSLFSDFLFPHEISNSACLILNFDLLLPRTPDPGTYRGMGQTISGLICIIETQGGSGGRAFFITVTVMGWHVLWFPNAKIVILKPLGILTCKPKQTSGQNIASDD